MTQSKKIVILSLVKRPIDRTPIAIISHNRLSRNYNNIYYKCTFYRLNYQELVVMQEQEFWCILVGVIIHDADAPQHTTYKNPATLSFSSIHDVQN